MTEHITVSRELLRQVLELLKKGDTYFISPAGDLTKPTIAALRTALEQPVQEPYGYYFRDDLRKFAMPGTGFSLGSTPPSDVDVCIPLYTAPQAQEKT